jgi:hypothetical protein
MMMSTSQRAHYYIQCLERRHPIVDEPVFQRELVFLLMNSVPTAGMMHLAVLAVRQYGLGALITLQKLYQHLTIQ